MVLTYTDCSENAMTVSTERTLNFTWSSFCSDRQHWQQFHSACWQGTRGQHPTDLDLPAFVAVTFTASPGYFIRTSSIIMQTLLSSITFHLLSFIV